MLLNLMLLAAVATPPSNALSPVSRPVNAGPEIEVWTSRNDVYQRGDQVRVYFRASESGYVTIFRIDTDGRVRVLFPREPWEDNYARARKQYEVRSYGDRYAFSIDDYPGQGYIFAVSSLDPFAYGALVRGDHWDYRAIAEGGRVTGDPYVALTDLVDRIIPANYNEYSYDVQPYYVEQHYQYPRFLCYDCHSYASYSYWNPYSYSCFRFRIVIYDDFYYYPRRYYRGQRVVYRNAPRIAPRYVFKDRAPSERYVTTVRERPVDRSGRQVVDNGVRGRDLGSSGRVPAPIITNTQRPRTSSDPSGSGATSSGTVGGGRRVLDGSTSTSTGGSQPIQPDDRRPSVSTPADRPARQPDDASVNQGSGRRPENIVPRAPVEEEPGRQQPQLERRGGRDSEPQPERRPDNRDTPRRGGSDASGGSSNEGPRRPAESERPRIIAPQREPDRQPERPRAEPRQPETRQPEARQPEARPQSREPERRAEPKSEPRRTPVEKPSDPETRGRRELN